MDRLYFSDQLRKIVIRHKHIRYILNVMRQSACLVINPITVDNLAAHKIVRRGSGASDTVMAPT